ncbi:Mitochondrial translocator assembly and maintenance protein 41 [Rhodotorula kratochvilovae]
MLRLASPSVSASPAFWAARSRTLLVHPRIGVAAAASFHSSPYARLDTERQSPSSSTYPPPNLTSAARRRLQPTSASSKSTQAAPPPFEPQQPSPTPAPPLSPPAADARVPKRRITSMNELPKTFGRNQIIEVSEEVQRDLEDVLKHFTAPVRYAFAYGSGVFRQKGYTDKDKPLLDFVFAVSHPSHWHAINMQQNPQHYSLPMRLLGSNAVSWMQEKGLGANVWFNVDVEVNGKLLKYGIISVDALCRDLLDWETLYISGRLHKPVRILQNDARVRLANQVNLASALRTALLLLPESFTEIELFEEIAGISYRGDFRMQVGENPHKVRNIVAAQLPAFRSLYGGLLKSFWKSVHTIGEVHPTTGGPDQVGVRLMRQDLSPAVRASTAARLPVGLRDKVLAHYERKWNLEGAMLRAKEQQAHDAPDRAEHKVNLDVQYMWERIVQDDQFHTIMNQSLSQIVARPTFNQSLKGILSAGPVKSLRYVVPKLKKKWGAAPAVAKGNPEQALIDADKSGRKAIADGTVADVLKKKEHPLENVEALEGHQFKVYLCSTASLGQAAMTDYLTQLPAEFFLTICELAHKPRGPYLGLVSKAFVPFARQRAFGGSVKVSTTARLTKLVDVLASSPGAASTVTNLYIGVPSTSDTDQPGTKTFLEALSSLEGWSNPFSPALYRNVDRYTNLGEFLLHVERRSDTLGRYTAPNPPVRLPFHLKRLHLMGCFFDNPAARDLIDSLSCSAAVLLSEQTHSQTGGMATFLGSLSSPLNISKLYLEQRSALDEDISAVLGRFSDVHTLEFSHGIAVTPLLPVLAGMPELATLWFCSDANVTSTDLLALVEGPHKLMQLRRLVIDVEPWLRWDDERSARFENDMVKLVEVCEATPVILDGDAIEEARDALKRRRDREERDKQEAEARKRDGAAAQRPRENVKGLAGHQSKVYLCSNASLGSTVMTDYLTQLPAELFLTICELAYDPLRRKRPYLGLVSKAFLAVARRLVFRKVRVTTYGHLSKLCLVVYESTGVAEYIEDVELDMAYDKDKGFPKSSTLSPFFRRLTRLENLKIKHSSRLAKFALAPKSSLSLPRLEELSIEDPLDGWANPFDPRNYRDLASYTAFDALELTIPRRADSIGRYRRAKQLPDLGCIGWLALRGHLHDNPAVADLISSYDIILGLVLRDDAEASHGILPTLLQAIRDPSSVYALSLDQAANDPAPLTQELARFPELEVIEFRHGTYTPAMLPLLQGLQNLEELYFCQGTRISISDLCSLVSGPSRAQKLKSIRLNLLSYSDDYERWVGWSDDFTISGVVKLLELAHEADVKLYGVAVEIARDSVEHRRV